jgi:hypothetical protein
MSSILSEAFSSAPLIASTGPIPGRERRQGVSEAARREVGKVRTHDGRLHGDDVVAQNLGERLQAVTLHRLLAHHDVGRRSIADTTGVTSANDASFGKHTGQLGQRLDGGLGARVLVLGKDLGIGSLLARGERDGSDLVLESSSVEGCEEARASQPRPSLFRSLRAEPDSPAFQRV